MYLSKLTETEKELFLNCAYALSFADGNFSSEEKGMIANYCEEMRIEITEPSMTDKNVIVEKIAAISNEQSKKIIIFELLGLAMVDGSYDKSEDKFISVMAEKFGFNDDFIKKCEKVISDYLTFQKKINSLILK